MHKKGHILWADEEIRMLKAHILYLEGTGVGGKPAPEWIKKLVYLLFFYLGHVNPNYGS